MQSNGSSRIDVGNPCSYPGAPDASEIILRDTDVRPWASHVRADSAARNFQDIGYFLSV